MKLKIINRVCILLISAYGLSAFAATDDFLVKDIEINGLQRIPKQTVLEYLPVHPGEMLSADDTSGIINALYQTGFFSDVQLSRKGNVLVIQVMERATIGVINITGNKRIKKEDLLNALKQAGIAEGETYNQATLQGMKQALMEQYYALGRYNATVETSVKPQTRNRVELDIKLYEGQIAQVRQINIIGNRHFSTAKLLDDFKMKPAPWWKPWSSDADYSADKLQEDLNSLRSFYFDRGYVRFTINSSQVNITPNRKDVYITINVSEGDIYHVKDYSITGDTIGQEDKLRAVIDANLKPGEVFSRKKILALADMMTRFYGNQGYANAVINPNPVIDDQNKLVSINFEVTAGPRVYVRHIDYAGNTRTADYVLRRETRQFEGALYSSSKIDETKRRLNLLGYVDNVEVKMDPVPGQPDQLDLTYSLKETSSTTASLQLGYSDTYGFLYGSNIVQSNYRGTGKKVSLGFDNSQYSQNYTFSYFNPYFTQSGISQGFSLYYQQTKPDSVNIASYTLDAYGGSMNYRMPLSDYDYFSFSYGYEYLRLLTGSDPSQDIEDFVDEHGNHFNNVKLLTSWTRNTYDRAILPTRGYNQVLGAEVGVPVMPNSLDYFKFNYTGSYYHPLGKGFILLLNTELGYGNGYDSYAELPFFKNYYAGGIGTVRGYDANTLGPKNPHCETSAGTEMCSNYNAIGGNVLTAASINLIFPNPISDKLRTSVFVDGGQVYQNAWQASGIYGLRYSSGVEADWVSPMGVLKFSLAAALNPHRAVGTYGTPGYVPGDSLEGFQFVAGTSF
ncbi:MAG: outer membrane protein assembly factor BamA [Gammaproteobacteria bacterium]